MEYSFLVEKVLIPILVGLISSFFGIRIGIYLEKNRLIKQLYSGYEEDLWEVIRSVDGVIQANRIIWDTTIMQGLKRNYPTRDISSYLQNHYRTKDKRLRQLVDNFVLNMNEYNQLQMSSRGSSSEPQPAKSNDLRWQECKNKSKQLTEKIQKRINRLIVE